MIWHELTQSAGWLDWSKYPYMFVHVELTFEFLNTVSAYVSVTGDRDFVKAHWPSIQAAYQYCRSLLDARIYTTARTSLRYRICCIGPGASVPYFFHGPPFGSPACSL
ncbi:MAG: hypothetical protein WCC99_20475 [Candidatus Sulfotelmatobacter sp.]